MEGSIETSIRHILCNHRDEIRELFTEQMTEMRRLFQEERQLLLDEVREAQVDILDKIGKLHQEGKKVADFQESLKDKVEVLENRLDSSDNKRKEAMKDTTTIITGHLYDINKESMTKTTENLKTLLQEQQEKLTEVVDSNQKKTTSSMSQISDDITNIMDNVVTKMAVKQDESIKHCMRDSFAHSNQEIISCLSQNFKEIKETNQPISDVKSPQTKLTNDVVQQCTQTIDDKLQQKMKEISDKLTRAKLQICFFVEKECQQIRDRLQQPIPSLPPRLSYICDFYVEELKTLIKTENSVFSFPWHIDQLGTSVQGCVIFPIDGTMDVWMKYGINPSQFGLEPRCGARLKVTATITDTSHTLTDIQVGTAVWEWDEREMKDNSIWGCEIGNVGCQHLLNQGFGDKERYPKGSILIRFNIEMLCDVTFL